MPEGSTCGGAVFTAAGVITLVFFADPVIAQPQKKPAGDVTIAATVNGEAIRLDEVDAQIKRRPPVTGPLTTAQARELRLAVVQDLIDDVLVKQYMRKHGPKVEPAEIESHLRALADVQRKQGKTLADYLRETGQTEAQVRETWTALLQFARLVEKEATPDRLRKYYEAYKDHFDRVELRVSHIVVRVGPTAAPGSGSPPASKLRKLRADIVAGTVTFADAARKHSFCPSATTGGDLGFITRKDAVAEEAFARAAFALKVGEVSEPVDTDFGVHLDPGDRTQAGDAVHVREGDRGRQGLLRRRRPAGADRQVPQGGTIRVTVP